MSRINVLYLHSHDTGRYTSPYGYALHTPNLQTLAERGTLFRQAFTANPTCSPSRAALLTGQYAHCNGMMGLAHRGGRLQESAHLLPTFLQSQGYETVLCGIQHVASHQHADHLGGYDRQLKQESQPHKRMSVSQDDETLELAAAYLQQRQGDQPFFLDVGFFATHRTLTTDGVSWHNSDQSPSGDPRYVRPPACLPDTPETRRDFADYAVAVSRLDALMGAMLTALDEAGLMENTLIVCTTDHGIAFPLMKCNLTDHGLGVMLTLAGPADPAGQQRFGGGQVVNGMVSQIDVFPTVCDALGLDHPDWLQGESLVKFANDPSAPGRAEVFAEVNYHAAHEPMRVIRTERYKYIRRLEVRDHPVLPNIDGSVSKNLLLERGFRQRPQEGEMLFDLTFDPQESCNRIDDPALADVADDLRRRLDRWMLDTDDPGVDGKVYIAGMTVNPVDGMDPSDSGAVVTE